MNEPASWEALNQGYLVAELARVGRYLEPGRTDTEEPTPGLPKQPSEIDADLEDMETASALGRLVEIFSLSSFERDVLLLCAGVELDAKFRNACAGAQGKEHLAGPTFGLALAALPEAHWSALTPEAPLRRWRFIEVGGGDTLATSPLRIDERILHYLAGVDLLDSRLRGLVRRCSVTGDLLPSQRAICDRLETAWSRVQETLSPPVVQLSGGDASTRSRIAAQACAGLGYDLHRLHASDLPAEPAEREALARLWEREAAIAGSALLVELVETDRLHADGRLPRFLESLSALLVVSGDAPHALPGLAAVRISVPTPTQREQRTFWAERLGRQAGKLNGQIAEVVGQFALSTDDIQAVCDQLLLSDEPLESATGAIWRACRGQSRRHLDDLAQRIEAMATWEDIVLPDRQIEQLKNIAAHVRHRTTVYEKWGFAAKGQRGLGISVLFTGQSGTGKTMAAEVLANELDLDLYRIDLSQVVSKYIGETEKNLSRVFKGAEAGGAILLFDEADALFGKRSEVRDSHDRYANVEISYLLQQMEEYRGLAILTTNMKNAVDQAFLRRIRFVVEFPFPDVAGRAEIWRRIFPVEMPMDGLDRDRLAKIDIAGGSIRSIALNAAFLAADEDRPVQPQHLLAATQSEFAKLEKVLTDKEWMG